MGETYQMTWGEIRVYSYSNNGTMFTVICTDDTMTYDAFCVVLEHIIKFKNEIINIDIACSTGDLLDIDGDWNQFGEVLRQCPILEMVEIHANCPLDIIMRRSYCMQGKRPFIGSWRVRKEEGNSVLVVVWMVGIWTFHKFPLPIELIRALREFCYY